MCFTEMARSIPNVPPVQGARDGEQPDVGPRRRTRQICLISRLGDLYRRPR
jgi:hypothetical protein